MLKQCSDVPQRQEENPWSEEKMQGGKIPQWILSFKPKWQGGLALLFFCKELGINHLQIQVIRCQFKELGQWCSLQHHRAQVKRRGSIFCHRKQFLSNWVPIQYWTQRQMQQCPWSKEASESVCQSVQLCRQGLLNRNNRWVLGLYTENVGMRELW